MVSRSSVQAGKLPKCTLGLGQASTWNAQGILLNAALVANYGCDRVLESFTCVAVVSHPYEFNFPCGGTA